VNHSRPSLLGTCLAACVVCQRIYGTSTIGINYDYFAAIDHYDAEFPQAVAHDTLREDFDRR
jgi:hypothetical protein